MNRELEYRIAVCSPKTVVGDVFHQEEEHRRWIREAEEKGAELILFPELSLTAYSCQDLFFHTGLQKAAAESLLRLVDESRGRSILVAAGLPVCIDQKLYNALAFFQDGRLLALVPKSFLPNYGEFYEARHFTPGPRSAVKKNWMGREVLFGTDILFTSRSCPALKIAAEICEDLWVPNPPSVRHALAGATVLLNASASDRLTGKADFVRELISSTSSKLLAAYAYAGAGPSESTQDMVFSGQSVISENGSILTEGMLDGGLLLADLDLMRLQADRSRMNRYSSADGERSEQYISVEILVEEKERESLRRISPSPFLPEEGKREGRFEEILTIQSLGLKKRLEHTRVKTAVLGISGGLDSTLALLVTVRAFDALKKDRKEILAVTMPAFGTTNRTYTNACELTRRLGATLLEVPIGDTVLSHLKDIGHSPEDRNVTYENAQARERTQVLMDIANDHAGLVVGTGDLSELVLGWATYNGDHMSMYGVNAGVPKTLVRYLTSYERDRFRASDPEVSSILQDILETPVSPELLPPEKGEISQKTESLVGPYELHDFFLFYTLRYGYGPSKIFSMARRAFDGSYEAELIHRWLGVFYRRFFSQQFKRSCLPDGPKVGSVSVSPRGDLRMPTDASVRVWLKEWEDLWD